jgi:hypothetical protein
MKESFDAVEMKRKIQEKLQKEMKGMSPEEEVRYIHEQITKSPWARRIWTQIRKQKSA